MPTKKSLKSFKTLKSAYRFLLTQNYKKIKPDLSLDRIKAFLEEIGNPQDKIKTIHIAGTSGKGSTSQFISSILQASGYKTGITISPYIFSVLEKIQVNDRHMTKKQFIKLVNQHSHLITKYKLRCFEALIAISFVYFYEKKVDYAVIETGLGGRMDATNVIKNPELAIITNVSLDHTDLLGNTIKKIAYQKEGIIKNESKAITGSVHIKRAKFINTEDYWVLKRDISGTEFKYKKQKYNLKMLGDFQIRNAILAIEAAKRLKLPVDVIKQGLLKAKHFARFEIFKKRPLVILDGAHNADKMKSFTTSLKILVDLKKYPNRNLLIAIKKDKDYKRIIKRIAILFDNIYITEFLGSHSAKKIEYYVNECFPHKTTKIYKNQKVAYNNIKNRMNNNDVLVVTGSLYLIRALIKN